MIDPDSDYPHNYTGHIRVTLADGSVIEERQPHLRGGAHEPLSAAEIEAKFRLNAKYGGWRKSAMEDALACVSSLYTSGPIDLRALRQ